MTVRSPFVIAATVGVLSVASIAVVRAQAECPQCENDATFGCVFEGFIRHKFDEEEMADQGYHAPHSEWECNDCNDAHVVCRANFAAAEITDALKKGANVKPLLARHNAYVTVDAIAGVLRFKDCQGRVTGTVQLSKDQLRLAIGAA